MQQKNKLIIHTDKIIDNYHLVREHYHSDFPLYAIVKSNAYGHGLNITSEALYETGHRHFGVFHMKEALRLSRKYNDIHILVMGDVPFQYIDEVRKNDIAIGIFSRHKWAQLLYEGLSDSHLHIKLETGMNRMGIKNIYDNGFRDLVQRSQEAGCMLSFYSHLSAAPEGRDKERVDKQYETFEQKIQFIKMHVKNYKQIHFFNSANLPFHDEHPFGARIGLLLYGYAPISNQSPFPWLQDLQPAMELHSWIMQIKSVDKGDYIGYGMEYQCISDKRIGYVPIGYADGLSRSLSNAGQVLTEYGKTRIVGIVNMNLIAIDLTDFVHVDIGDRITILGENDSGSLTACDHADVSGTIPYEILTSIGNQEIWRNYG